MDYSRYFRAMYHSESFNRILIGIPMKDSTLENITGHDVNFCSDLPRRASEI